VLNFWEGNIIAYVPPAEAIEAVNIVTASFDAEQGQAGGSVVNISIKSGTNHYHGAAWEYNTNSDLKARNFFYYGANNPKNILNTTRFHCEPGVFRMSTTPQNRCV
jgi:hypothetical protein